MFNATHHKILRVILVFFDTLDIHFLFLNVVNVQCMACTLMLLLGHSLQGSWHQRWSSHLPRSPHTQAILPQTIWTRHWLHPHMCWQQIQGKAALHSTRRFSFLFQLRIYFSCLNQSLSNWHTSHSFVPHWCATEEPEVFHLIFIVEIFSYKIIKSQCTFTQLYLYKNFHHLIFM